MMDTLDLCQFVYGPTWCLYGPNDTAEMVRAVTGWDVTVDELMTIGKRRLNLMRTFNAREGFGRKDDQLPKDFFKPLVGTGPTAGVGLSRTKNLTLPWMNITNWPVLPMTGSQPKETLKALDIELGSGISAGVNAITGRVVVTPLHFFEKGLCNEQSLR